MQLIYYFGDSSSAYFNWSKVKTRKSSEMAEIQHTMNDDKILENFRINYILSCFENTKNINIGSMYNNDY